MKTWSHIYPGEKGEVVEEFVTEDQIMQYYWSFWEAAMIRKYGIDHELTTRENCIDNWVTGNWAMEVIDGKSNLREVNE